jgi:Protein of unknown function (DUF3987)
MNGKSPSRRLGSWIESYLEYTDTLPSPPLFRKWVAIFFIAAAMERKLWVRTMGSSLYPNLYIFLVGPSGIGKGQAIYRGEALLREVPDLKIGPSDMTSASMIDALNEAVRRFVFVGKDPFLEFNSLTVVSRELGVLIPGWDTSLMNNLTDIYDGFTVDQKRRGKDLRIKIANPQINLIGACTPAYLNDVMPASAWDQGFISRTLLIYSGDRIKQDPFAEDAFPERAARLHGDLLHDLKGVAVEHGQMAFTKPAARAIKAWIDSGCPPEPTHQRLQFYNARRVSHLLKLCMISSISRTSDKVIGLEHYSEALDWLVEAEVYMPDIFKSMVTGGDSSAMEEAWNYVWTLYAKETKPIAEHRIVHFLRERVPAHSVMRVLDVMVKSKMFEIVIADQGFQGYKPTSKETRLG